MSIVKAGVVYALRFDQWFRPYNANHRLCWEVYKLTGKWPDGALPDNIWLHFNWEEFARNSTKDIPLHDDAKDYLAQLERLTSLAGKFSVRIHPLLSGFYCDYTDGNNTGPLVSIPFSLPDNDLKEFFRDVRFIQKWLFTRGWSGNMGPGGECRLEVSGGI